MNVGQLTAELGKGRVRPAYLIAGEEPLLRDAALGTLPVMAERRLVVLREGRGAGVDESFGRVIEGALEAGRADFTAVLVVVARKPDRRLRWVKAFREPAAEVDCEAPTSSRELEDFLEREARRLEIELTRDASERLVDRVGPHLLLLRQEVEKLALHVGTGGRVDGAAVTLSVSSVAEESIWDLTDAIGQGRAADSLVQLAQMLGQGQASQAVLGALASHFRRLLRVGQGEPIKAPPFVARKLEQQARRFTPARLLGCLRAIHRADVELKGEGVLRPERALEQLVIQLSS